MDGFCATGRLGKVNMKKEKQFFIIWFENGAFNALFCIWTIVAKSKDIFEQKKRNGEEGKEVKEMNCKMASVFLRGEQYKKHIDPKSARKFLGVFSAKQWNEFEYNLVLIHRIIITNRETWFCLI